jgi:hypothetical protein
VTGLSHRLPGFSANFPKAVYTRFCLGKSISSSLFVVIVMLNLMKYIWRFLSLPVAKLATDESTQDKNPGRYLYK